MACLQVRCYVHHIFILFERIKRGCLVVWAPYCITSKQTNRQTDKQTKDDSSCIFSVAIRNVGKGIHIVTPFYLSYLLWPHYACWEQISADILTIPIIPLLLSSSYHSSPTPPLLDFRTICIISVEINICKYGYPSLSLFSLWLLTDAFSRMRQGG